ncbi:cytochrome c biogenesis CcdA family protein, partial [Streptomyces sp. NPDC088812]
GNYFAETVNSGALLIAAPLAMIAGIVSFLSPCILPLVPGYLGYVSGLANPTHPDNRRRVLTGVGLFILGFAAVFTLYGAAFGTIGHCEAPRVSWRLGYLEPAPRGTCSPT